MKGTGRWTVQDAARAGRARADDRRRGRGARALVLSKPTRARDAARLRGPSPIARRVDRKSLVDDVRAALYAAKVMRLRAGHALLRAASRERNWSLDLAELARIWKGGCIIRAQFLGRIQAAYRPRARAARTCCSTPDSSRRAGERQGGWRRSSRARRPAACRCWRRARRSATTTAIRRERLPANLIQAQRDYFGAHTYERVDRPGSFHTDWHKTGG